MFCSLILLLPLFNLVFFAFFSNFIGITYIYTSLLTSLLICVFSVFTFFSVINYHYIYYIKIFDWVDYFDFFVGADFLFDELSSIMLLVVTTIALFVQSFSKWYMKNDPYYYKFFFYLNFFIFFMIILVLSNNIVFLFIGWEGIGIFSYILINFWHTRLEANRSALKAIVFNKIGDLFVYLFIVLFYFIFENFNLYVSRNVVFNYLYLNFYFFDLQANGLTILSFCLVIAAAAKSAQLFLHVWLPDAMEGPTPVSALLHAATMVTAGIFLLLKFSWIIQNNINVLYFIILLGVLTNLFASITAMFQSDIKKIIAYSTASQLGLIFIAFGLSKFSLALFHIFTHAFFKALLFLLAGVVIHYSANKQDLRLLKNFNQFNILLVYISFLIASLTLSTLPFFSAYYSKDFFVQLSLLNVFYFNYVSFFFLNFSVFTTAIYSYKILEYIFWNKKLFNFNYSLLNNINKHFFISIYFLVFFSVLIGYFAINIFKYDFLVFSDNFVYNLNFSNAAIMGYFEYSSLFVLTFMSFGFVFGFYLNNFFSFFNFLFSKFFYKLYFFFNKKFLFDNIYFYFYKFFYNFLIFFFKILDRSLVESNINFLVSNFKSSHFNRIISQKIFVYVCLFICIILFAPFWLNIVFTIIYCLLENEEKI